MKESEDYSCKTFSLALPIGVDRTDLPKLLENLASELRKSAIKRVLDLTFQSIIDEDAREVFSVTVYYR